MSEQTADRRRPAPGGSRPRPAGVSRPGPAGGVPEKAKDFKGPWVKLILYCKDYIPAMVISRVVAAVGTAFTIIGPDQIGKMTNEIEKTVKAHMAGRAVGIDFDAISRIGLLLIILYSCSALMNLIQIGRAHV